MFRNLVISVLLIALVAAPMQALLTVIGFAINQDYVAAQLCIRRAKPASCCKGRCFLRKELEKERRREARQQLTRLEHVSRAQEEAVALLPAVPPEAPTSLVEGRYHRAMPDPLVSQIFRPPLV